MCEVIYAGLALLGYLGVGLGVSWGVSRLLDEEWPTGGVPITMCLWPFTVIYGIYVMCITDVSEDE